MSIVARPQRESGSAQSVEALRGEKPEGGSYSQMDAFYLEVGCGDLGDVRSWVLSSAGVAMRCRVPARFSG